VGVGGSGGRITHEVLGVVVSYSLLGEALRERASMAYRGPLVLSYGIPKKSVEVCEGQLRRSGA